VGQSFLWGAPFKAKHVFYPDQYPPAGFLHLGESHHGATWLRLGGSWGTDLGLKNWNSPPLEVQKKKSYPGSSKRLDGQICSPKRRTVCFWVA